MREETTLQDYGTVGASQAQGTDVCTIFFFTPGRYKVWGTCRHTLADGFRLLANGGVVTELSNDPNINTPFGPIVVDILTTANALILELFVATGASDTASGTLYAQKINQ